MPPPPRPAHLCHGDATAQWRRQHASLSLAAGVTALFGTSRSFSLAVDQNTGGGAIAKGFARILSTSKSLVCTAFIADPGNNLPVSMVALTIIAKTKQKAAN